MIHVFLAALLAQPQPCNATIFGQPGDKWVGGKAIFLKRRVNARDIGVAHRTLPLGTRIKICNVRTGRCATARVIDRGPYGAMYRGRWVLKKRTHHRGTWRSCLDLTPALGRRLRHNGYEDVTYERVKK